MALYGGIDLHSNNHVVALLDEQDHVVYQRRLPNELDYTLEQLAPFKLQIQGLAVESTYNWYWLVDGLMEAGYQVQLAHTTEMQQYSGLKYTDDSSDARWLARMLHLGLLPTGYIYPKEERAVRDLLRKRSHLVQGRTAQILAVQGWLCQQTGHSMSASRIKRLTDAEVEQLLGRAESALVVKSSLAVIRCLGEQIESLERTVQTRCKLRAEYQRLLTVNGIGSTLALTIMLETGDIGRFPTAGHYASYCRCVDSKRVSNTKRKGSGNVKNGNRYLAWAFVEAAHFAVRYNPLVKRFYERKRARRNAVVAIKAVAHKLARACFHVLRDQVEFDVSKAFS